MLKADGERMRERSRPWMFVASGKPLGENFVRIDAASVEASLPMRFQPLRAFRLSVRAVQSGRRLGGTPMGDAVDATKHPEAPVIVAAYDWGALGHVVDVGGGDGELLVALLTEYPTLRGTVVDLPATAETARRTLAAAGLGERAQVVAADFFAALPVGAEGYVLSSVVSCWADEKARALLRNCATAAGEDGAVFVIEKVADARGADDASGDAGGQTRDVPELTTLAESAGLTVTAVHTADDVAIVELALA